MSLSQIELIWVRVRLERECFWVNLRDVNKVSESRCLNPRWQCLNPTWQGSRWLPSSGWLRMNKVSFFCAKWMNPAWQNSRWLPSSSWMRMNEFESNWISLSQSFVHNGWIQDWQNSRWLPLSSWVRMNEWSFFVQMVGRQMWVSFFLCKWWEPFLASVSEYQRKN